MPCPYNYTKEDLKTINPYPTLMITLKHTIQGKQHENLILDNIYIIYNKYKNTMESQSKCFLVLNSLNL